MAVIDLSTGDVTDQVNAAPEDLPAPQPIQAQSKGIINLETGGFETDQEVVQQEPVKEVEKGLFDFFTGSAAIEQTPELGELPEFGTTTEGDTFRIAVGMLSTFDEKAQREMIQQAIPEVVFETTADGSTIIEVPTKDGGTRRSVLNQPGLSAQDLTTGVAKALSFVPAAKIAGLGKTLLTKFGIGAAGAGATEQASQELGIQLGRKERDPVETAIAAGTGGIAEVVVPAVQAFRGARQAKRTGIEQEAIDQALPNVQAAQEATEQTGIPLFQAQQTAIPAQLEKQAFVAQLPAGTQSAVKGLQEQNKAAGDAVEEFLRQIAPDESVITGAERIRTASQQALDKAKNIRAEKASPLYKEAFQEGTQVDLSPVKRLISGKLDDLPETGEISNSLKRVEKLIKGDSPSLKKLHNAKLEIDQMIANRGSDSLGNTTKRELREIQESLLNQIDDASPSYKQAREIFKQESPAVSKVQDSIIGKIAGLDDTQLKQVATKLFDPSQTNPKVLLNAKRAIQEVDQDAWDQIVRVELERRLGSIKSIAESGTVENIPGQLFRALFPNDKSTKVLMNALDGESRSNLQYIRTALNRAKLGRPGGSQTAGREEIKRELRGGIYQSFRNLFRNPINTIVSAGEESSFNKAASALSKALYDPTWKAQLTKIRKLSPKSPAAARAMTQLLDDIQSTEARQDSNQFSPINANTPATINV